MSGFVKGPSGAVRTPLKVSALSALAATGAVAGASTVSRPLVVKIGGRAVERLEAMNAFVSDVAALGAPVVLVHGGGVEVTAWSEKLRIEARFTGGLRVTDAATLDVATAVLAGLANKRLVARLRAAGLDAVGLSAADGAVEVVPHALADQLGAVGQPTATTPLLETLLGAGHTPVLASIGACDGGLLNVNADDLASVVAAGIGARALILLSDTEGVKLGGHVVPALDRESLRIAIGNPDVQGGMRPKLASVMVALEGGVPRAFIGMWSGPGSLAAILDGRAPGTRLSLDPMEETPVHG